MGSKPCCASNIEVFTSPVFTQTDEAINSSSIPALEVQIIQKPRKRLSPLTRFQNIRLEDDRQLLLIMAHYEILVLEQQTYIPNNYRSHNLTICTSNKPVQSNKRNIRQITRSTRSLSCRTKVKSQLSAPKSILKNKSSMNESALIKQSKSVHFKDTRKCKFTRRGLI